MRHRFLFLVMIGLAGMTSSCSDTTIDPFENEDKYFTIWGYLDQLSSNHSIRVIPVTRFAERILSPTDDGAQIDAEVFSTDLASGERTRWNHTLAELEDGSYGHVFSSHFLINPKRSYRIDVVRSDGKTTSAETRVPAINADTLFVRGPVIWEQDSSFVYQDIYIPQIASPWEIKALYRWHGGDQSFRMSVPYGRPGVRTEDGGWKVRLNITEDRPEVQKTVDWAISIGMIPPSGRHQLVTMGFQVRILDANWDPPNGIFDPEVLAQPGVLSNVENGHGFFGSIGLFIQEWQVDTISKALGYPY
ncbi:MAG: hypothetical protein O3B41_05460 [Bacteroidetes bacterium]|nr:hypothetical protein [Bacteroidota bacterium]